MTNLAGQPKPAAAHAARRAILCAWIVALVTVVGWTFPVTAQTATKNSTPPAAAKRVAIDILTQKPIVAPGEEIWIALRETIEPGWHTYWTNPGDSGEPTTLTWKLPAGFKADAPLFPPPTAIPVGPLVNYGYSDEVLLLSRLTVPADAKPGPTELAVSAEWLVCKDICIPESGEAKLPLTVGAPGAATPNGPDAARLAAAVLALPSPSPWPVAFSMTADDIRLTVKGLGAGGKRPNAVTFFPDTWGHVNHAAPQSVTWAGDDLVLVARRGDLKKETLTGLTGLLVLEASGDRSTARQAFKVTAGMVAPSAVPGGPAAATVSATAPVTGSAPIAGTSTTPPKLALPAAESISIWQALLFAVLGGMILNLMPCVFPVLSLKAVALAATDRRAEERRREALAYLAGVLASFMVLALLLLGLRQAGQGLGWGFQFQSPAFVLIMAGLFFGLGLTLSGVLSFGEGLTGLGDTLARRSGVAGTFFTGALATIAATPCTAPFMGAAIGYALGASALTGFVVLMAMGLGFAAPVVALSALPGLQRLLPRPGRWMDTFKQVMAFPLYASAAWMVWVLSLQTGSDGVLAAMALIVGLGFLAWLWSWLQTNRRPWHGFAVGLAVVALTAFVIGMLDGAQGARTSMSAGSTSPMEDTPLTDVTGLPIIRFSENRIASLQNEGRPVFVNLTAAWCITCKVNEKVAMSSERMRAAFITAGVAYVKGDWTRQDPDITRFLQAFGRAGVPLYLMYPGKSGAPPRVLDQVLTETHVLAELQAAMQAGK